MTIEQIDRIVRHANPVPDVLMLESADVSDLHIEQWREDMQTHEKVEVTETEDPSRRGVWIGLAAAAVAIVIGILVVIQSQAGPEVADTPPDEPVVTVAPEETPDGQEALATSSGFMDAKASYDTSTVLAYLAEDATVDMGPAIDVATVADEIAWQQASGLSLTPDGCDWLGTTTDGRGDQTRCYAMVSSPVSDANGSDPGRFTFDFIIVDGVIESAVLSDLDNYSLAIWEPFEQWVLLNRPTDHDAMFSSNGAGVVITQDSLRLWEQYIAEYAAEQDPRNAAAFELALSFANAYGTGDIGSASALLAPTATIDIGPANSADALAAGYRWEKAYGTEESYDHCTVGEPVAGGVSVVCTGPELSAVDEALGLPTGEACMGLVVADGLIVAAEDGFCPSPGVDPFAGWAALNNWIELNHPDVIAAIAEDNGEARLTDESISLWEELVAEFIAEQNG